MKIITIIVCSILYGYTAYYNIRSVIADVYFREGYKYLYTCKKTQHKRVCIAAATFFNKAVIQNPKEYYYRYILQDVLCIIGFKEKNIKLINIALKHLDAAEKYSWDKHYVHLGRASILLKFKRKDQALSEMNKALVYIPHNAKLLTSINTL